MLLQNKEVALEAMRKYYGFSGFRPGQWESISAVLEGHDVVVLISDRFWRLF